MQRDIYKLNFNECKLHTWRFFKIGSWRNHSQKRWSCHEFSGEQFSRMSGNDDCGKFHEVS